MYVFDQIFSVDRCGGFPRVIQEYFQVCDNFYVTKLSLENEGIWWDFIWDIVVLKT